MITKFDDFILEGLLLESNVIYSDKFKNVLSKMADDPIASELLKMENSDLDVTANFIGVKDTDVQLLILKSQDYPDKIIGRVLVWKLDDGNHLMDYIYTSRDSDKKIFLDYAEDKGWESIEPNGWSKTFTAHMKPVEFDSYPSVDTMNNWDPRTGQISNQSFPGSRQIIWSEDGDDDDFEWDNDEDDY